MTEANVTDMSEFREQHGRTLAAPVWSQPAWTLPEAPGVAPPTGTVTFLLTDIEGSTPLWETAPEEMAAAVSRHYEILDAAVRARSGVRPVEQGEGDSMVAAFARASDAVAAALDAQRALVAEVWPDGAGVSVRMALHTGEARLRDGMYYVGPSIIRCARLRSLAHGGQVLLSTTATDLLVDGLPPDAALLPLGAHRLKGMRQPERVFQLAHPALPARFPPLCSLEMLPNTLPVQLTSFVGREAELTALADLMGRQRLVTLVGPGGCGKTRLAAQAAGEAFYGYPDGVWWVELATVTDPAEVPLAVMGALSLDAKGFAPIERITGYLQDKRALVVLDNCEQVLGAAAGFVASLLVACSGLTALATSREPLAVSGEAIWRVDPLPLPAVAEDQSLEAVLASDAVQLFLERAVSARPEFRCDAATAPTVAAICTRLDGIPLAIELAAARVRALSPERLLQSLAHRFRVLTGGSRTAQPRQQTLAASVEWSHDLLTDSERTLLRRLAVFVGSFDLDAAEGVAAGGPLAGWEVLTVLTDLVDKSLVVFDGERYRLLQTIREFAAARLEATDEGPATRNAHLMHYAGVAAVGAAELERSPQTATLERLEAARENLVVAVDWALATQDHDAALRICADMALFWQLHGHHSESLAFVRRVLDGTPADPTPLRVRALWAAGLLGLFGMDAPGGYGTVEAGLAATLATATGNDEILGRVLGLQGFIANFASPAAAVAVLADAHAAAERGGDRYGMAAASTYAAFALVFGCDRPDLAEPHLAAVGAEAAATGSPLWGSWHAMVSGVASWRTGRLERAAELLGSGDELSWALGEPVIESWCARWLADVHIEQGEFAAAERVLARSASWMDRSSCGRLEILQSRVVHLALAQGNLSEARSLLAALESVLRPMAFAFATAELDLLGGRIAVESGDLATGRVAATEALAISESLGTPWYVAGAANLAGRLARAEGELAAAEDAHHRALAVCAARGFAAVAAETLECLASLAVVGESWAESARLYGAADTLRARTGYRRLPLDVPRAEADSSALADALGEALGSAVAEGGALTLEEAVAYASRARGERKRPSSGWASLTPTELQVAELVAEGLTNVDIGRRLFVMPGTVKVHLHNIFVKLGITRRAELATRATARRLTDI
jgi:predicted ATPase/class 3 adenylate cyclase/DNA-binding CsgD family transcriptional regulator